MANLVVDIGNTALKAAWAEGVTLGKTFRYQGERMTDFILSLTVRTKPDTILVASAGNVTEADRARLATVCGRLIVIDSSHRDIYREKELPLYLSPDRFASIVAVRYLFKGKGCTVFDFGTALSIDFVEADGRYSGGNISPGCRTRFKALNRYSRSLPLLDTPDAVEDKGSSTASAVESGVISGIMFELQGYFGMSPENIAVFTGGDAIYFAKRVKNSIFVVCNLVLIGLAIVADENIG